MRLKLMKCSSPSLWQYAIINLIWKFGLRYKRVFPNGDSCPNQIGRSVELCLLMPPPSFFFRSHSGLSSFLNNQTTVNSTPSDSHLDPSPDPTHKTHASPNTNPVPPALTVMRSSTAQTDVMLQSSLSPTTIQTRDLQNEAEEDIEQPVISVTSTLDSKIDGFLQGNPGLRGLNMGFPPVLPWTKAVDSPSASTENLGGTPVRDESGATPTQDEVMDEPAVQPFLYQGRPLQTASTAASALVAVSGLPVSTYANDSWQEQNRHIVQYGPGLQHSGNRYQRNFTVKQEFPSSGIPLIETGHPQHAESSMADKNQNSNKNNEILERISVETPLSNTGADNTSLANDGWYCDARGHDQKQRAGTSSELYKGKPHQSEEHGHDTSPAPFFNTPLPPPPPIPKLPPPPPQDFLPSVGGGIKDPVKLTNIADNAQAGGDIPVYLSTNAVPHDDYDERLLNRIPVKEPLHPHLSMPGPQHCAVAPHPVRLGPRNGPVDLNHRPRIPVHNQQRPVMPRPSPPSTVQEYCEALSPSHALSEDAYVDPHCDVPPCSSPPPHTLTFYPEERALPLHHPEPRLRPRFEHRTPPPHHYRPPRPGHYPPQRPLHRPPPPRIPHPSEPLFQRGKRHGPPFGGPPRPAGPFYPPKRPFLPPRY